VKGRYQLLAILAAALAAGPAAAQTQYDYFQIDYPGQTQTQVFGINDSGDVVGNGVDPNTLPFVYASMDGTLTDVAPAAGYDTTSVLGINDAGDMVGSVRISEVSVDGFIRGADGTYTIFSHPDGVSNTLPRGINNKGLISGYRRLRADNSFLGGFVYDSRTQTFTDIDIAANSQVIAHGINSKGEVVGNARIFPASDPCGAGVANYGWIRARDGSVRYFTVNGQYTSARGINDAGLIVGQTEDPSTFERKGFVVRAPKSNCETISVDTSELLDFPGSEYTFAEGITNSGVIVGVFRDALNNFHGFIATEQ
jgi:uncharacterized membrane protein